MKCAIIILNWNAARETLSCVESIKRWSHIFKSIYVVDNNSAKYDQAILSEQSYNFNLIKNAVNGGFSGGNNIGIKAALDDNHTTILLLNNDARIGGKDISLLLETLQSSTNIGVAGPVIYEQGTNELMNAGGKDIGWNYISHLKVTPEKEKIYDVDYVSGTAILIRAEIFRKIGLLDERYFFSGEIADFCKRVHKYREPDGFHYRVVINPHAQATHSLHTVSSDKERLYTYYVVRSRYLYIRKFLLTSLPVLYPYWIYKHLNHAFNCYKIGKSDVTRTILRGLIHGLTGRAGPMKM